MSDKINNLLKTLFKTYRVVFWYDPDGEMREIFDNFKETEVNKLVLNNDELAVKYRILRLEPEHKFLVYAPRHRPEPENNWLLDLEQGNFVFSADPVTMVTQELGVTPSLKRVLQERLGFFRNRVERLEPLSALASPDWTEEDLLDGMLSIACARNKKERESIFSLDRIIISLCTSKDMDDQWEKIVEWKLDNHFFKRVEQEYSIHLDTPEPRGVLLQLFSRAFAYQAGEQKDKAHRMAFLFIETWRQNKLEAERYEDVARELEQELHIREHLEGISDNETLSEIDVFPCVDYMLLLRFSTALSDKNADTTDIRKFVHQRTNMYWYNNDAQGQLRYWYDAIDTACSMLDEIVRQKKTIGFRMVSKADLWEVYNTKLHLIDRLYRKFNFYYQNAGMPPSLATAADRIAAVYLNDFLKPIAEGWQSLLDTDNTLDFAPIQNEFFTRYVLPTLKEGKRVFVLISDGMRWEIGKELEERLTAKGRFNVQISPMRALVPTVTAHGMAALLPHTTLERTPDKNEVRIDGQIVSGIEARSKYLTNLTAATLNGLKACAMTIQEFLSLSSEALENKVSATKLVYLYSSKIDAEGHSFDAGLPAAVEAELEQLLNAVVRISRLGSASMFITADHGFLYSGAARDEEFMLNVQELNGETWRDQRYILGRDLASVPGMLALSSNEPAIPPEINVLIAKGLMKIRRKGAVGNFIHGGMSLQELCIPLLQISVTKKDVSRRTGISVLASRAITTPSFAIKLYQEEPIGGNILPHKIRMWFESTDGTIISNKNEFLCNSNDPEEVNRAFAITFEFLPASRHYKGQQIYLKMYTLADGDTEIHYKTEEFQLKQIAYDIDVF